MELTLAMQPLRQSSAPGRTRRRSRLGHYLRVAVVTLPLLWIAQRAVFGSNGLRALWHQQRQYAAAMAHVHALEAQNRQLNQSVHALQSNPDAIAAIAREQLHLTKPGEVVYTYPIKPSGPASSANAALPH